MQYACCRSQALRDLGVSLYQMRNDNNGTDVLVILASLAHADITAEELDTSGIAQKVLPFRQVGLAVALPSHWLGANVTACISERLLP